MRLTASPAAGPLPVGWSVAGEPAQRGCLLHRDGLVADLVFLDLPRRVAKVLLSQPRGDDGVIGQKMTQEEFAHRVGGARQSVNAALRGFERRGWIQVRHQAVTVKQAAALSRFAGD